MALPTLLSAILPGLMAGATPAGMPVGSEPDALDSATARMVGGIIDYSRWPGEPEPLAICLVAAPRHVGGFGQIGSARDRDVRIRVVDSTSPTLSNGCQILYIGPASLAETRRITATARGAAVLTIAEADPACRSEAMFCLIPSRGSLSFRLNIDAVSRSQVRVDPRVLRMAKGN